MLTMQKTDIKEFSADKIRVQGSLNNWKTVNLNANEKGQQRKAYNIECSTLNAMPT